MKETEAEERVRHEREADNKNPEFDSAPKHGKQQRIHDGRDNELYEYTSIGSGQDQVHAVKEPGRTRKNVA